MASYAKFYIALLRIARAKRWYEEIVTTLICIKDAPQKVFSIFKDQRVGVKE
jgi:hypothetical protein